MAAVEPSARAIDISTKVAEGSLKGDELSMHRFARTILT
jgi:hypothetical protein